MARWFTILVLCLLVAACGREPDEAVLRGDVEAALATAFGDDTFRVADFARRGSAIDSTAAEGESRRVVYYDVELELVRDLALGDWEDPGAATLVTLLGAGPRSIQGVKAGGNAAGDRITAHASAIYREDDGRWAFVMPAGHRDAGPPPDETGVMARPSQEALDRLAEITRSIEAGGSRVAQSVLDQELRRSVARISGRLSRIEDGYPLAAGANRGEYAAFGSALAQLAQADGMRIVPIITGGSEENLELLRGDNVILALAQADAARDAYRGAGPFAASGEVTSVRALGSLYPELVHIVVRADAGLASAGDLKGARIAMGPERSAVRATLQRVLAAHGLQPGRDYVPVPARFGEALPALRSGEVDAVAHVIGLPATPLREALGDGTLSLLPLDAGATQALVSPENGMIAATIPAGMYPQQRSGVPTIAVPALLLTSEALSNEEAARLVRIVYQGSHDLLAQGSAQGSQVSVRTARRGLTVPLHPGAEQALMELEGGIAAPDRPPANDAAPTQGGPPANDADRGQLRPPGQAG